jgi:hypothetical protein
LHEADLVGKDALWFFASCAALWSVAHYVSVIAKMAEQKRE